MNSSSEQSTEVAENENRDKVFIHINLPDNKNQVVWVLRREPVLSPEELGKPLEYRAVSK
jgi:hypothetical protein